MTSDISRRDLLKLLPLMSLLLTLKGLHLKEISTTGMPSNQQRPNILILLFDALSAAHLPLHGYQRDTTPNLARLAERATVYHRHYAAGNFTTPGTASLLTGMYPWSHRALHLDGRVTKDYVHRNLFQLLGDSFCRIAYPQNTLAHLLLHGFRSDIDVYLPPEEFGLVGGTLPSLFLPNDADVSFRSIENLLFRDWKLPSSLFAGLADRFRMLAHQRVGQKELAMLYPKGIPTMVRQKWFFLVEDVIDGVIALMSHSPQPFVAYLHLFPPHEPYRPHRDYLGIFDDGWIPAAKDPHVLSSELPEAALNEWRVEYDEYLAFVDAQFGRLYDFLNEAGIMDNSYVVVTSDHGQLFERGVHGHITELLYEPVIHIPLLISTPGRRQRDDVYTPTSCVDLLPTLLDATGHAIPDWCEGKVLPAADTENVDSERIVFSVEAKGNAAHRPLTTGTAAVIRGQYKLIHYFGYDGYENEYELYDLISDPQELENLYSTTGSIAADLQRVLQEKIQEMNRPYTT